MYCHVRLATLAALLVACLIVAATARPQAPQSAQGPAIKTACTHDGYELWDDLKMLPVQFIEFNSNTATWKYQDERMMKVGSFALAENGQYISREEKKVGLGYVTAHKDATWLCYYCAHCHLLLIA